jgi:hypothetical protein
VGGGSRQVEQYRRVATTHTRFRDTFEAQLVTGLELAELPEVVFDNGRGADEAAQAGAVRTEDHRHVAGVVDAADGVGVVVDVGGMQAGLTAIGSRPARLRTDQPHAGATRVVVHFPGGGVERLDVPGREEVGRAMRSIIHADRPVVAVCGTSGRRNGLTTFHSETGAVQSQYITGTQGAPAMAAELSQRERGARAQVLRHVEAAADGEIGALARAADAAEREHRAARHGYGFPVPDGLAIQRRFHRRAGQRNHRVRIEAQRGAGHGQFQRRRALGVGDDTVRQAQRQ